jgi:hypothetical protein
MRILTITLLMAGACTVDVKSITPGGGSSTGDDDGSGSGSGAMPVDRYVGLGGEQLAHDPGDLAGAERLRIKPFSALQGEYTRVLGAAPAGLDAAAADFVVPPARYYQEPTYESGSLTAAHDLGLAGCTTFVTANTAYAAKAPADASSVCSDFAERFWARGMSTTEAAACVDLAQNKIAASSDANDRWSRVCAAVITSAGFLTF